MIEQNDIIAIFPEIDPLSPTKEIRTVVYYTDSGTIWFVQSDDSIPMPSVFKPVDIDLVIATRRASEKEVEESDNE